VQRSRVKENDIRGDRRRSDLKINSGSLHFHHFVVCAAIHEKLKYLGARAEQLARRKNAEFAAVKTAVAAEQAFVPKWSPRAKCGGARN